MVQDIGESSNITFGATPRVSPNSYHIKKIKNHLQEEKQLSFMQTLRHIKT